MKQFYLFFIVMMAISCQRETSIIIEKNYQIDKIKKYLPSEVYSSGKKVIFQDKSGKSRVFSIEVQNYEVKDINGNKIKKLYYNLREANNTIFYFVLSAQPLVPPNSSSEMLSIRMLTTIHNGLFAKIIINENGDTWFNQMFQTLDLNGKTFSDVFYGNIELEEIKVCNEIYYTANQGIIGFRDEIGELWVLEEII